VAGELRFGYRYAFAVLGGVYSSRVYLKQENWECQQLLQRYVEPVNAWTAALGKGSGLPLVRHAWRTLMQNHPHDSICGCSIDPVHREMMTRFRAVRDIGDSILERTFARLLPADPTAAGDDKVLWLFNPSPVRRSSVAQAEIRFYRQDVVVGLNPDVRVAPALPPVRSLTLEDGSGATVRHQVISRGSGYDITYTDFNYPKQTHGDRFTVLVDASGLPPLGMAGYRVRKGGSAQPATRLRAGVNWIANDYLRLEAARNGSLTLKDLRNGETYRGLNVFESTGDVGDEYNYSFPKRDRRVLSTAGSASIRVIEKGPLRAALRITLAMRVPAAATPDRSGRSSRSVLLRVVTTVRLTESSRFAEIATTVMNNARDHRFRALFPSGVRTSSVLVDSQFCLVERKRREYDLRKFAIEHPAQVAPMQRFVTVSGTRRGLTLLSSGIPEYELLGGGDGTLALTLLRCVGLLAGDDLITRPGGKAGWHNETPEAQCQGECAFRYALLPHTAAEIADRSLLNAVAEEFHLPFLPIRRKDDPGVEALSFLSELDPRLSLSALKEAEEGGGVILRVQNPGPTPVTSTLRFTRKLAGAWSSRLGEEKLSVLPLVEGSGVEVEVPASGLCTIRLEFVD
jgi:alpha-mannosidase